MNQLLAQVNLREELHGPDVDRGISGVSNVYELISLILPNVYIISGIILLIYAVAGGFILVSSGGNTQNTQQGQKIITNAIIGFIIIFASFWIIQIIEVITGIPLIDPSSVLSF